ncbi:DsbC family protein [Klebsiella sp. PL-2018]|uniref:DsbC family protein n=1 Tax=Klebsiella TaxID=570 RepID=UPI001C24109A|nr:DsbC family protein [Klebsiella sp. PL-2018]QXD01006.1 TrbB protein [Klebsiella sp. PL-2018]
MSAYHYSATRQGRHILLSATDASGRPTTLLWLKVSEVSHLIIRDARLCLLFHDVSGVHESVLVEPAEHNAAAMLNAITRSTEISDGQRARTAFLTTMRHIAVIAFALLIALGVYRAMDFFRPVNLDNAPRPAFITAPPDMPQRLTPPAGPLPEAASHPTPAAPGTRPDSDAIAARKNLASVLKRNAERGMFTIALSSGHKRTLHAFLDPQCPNCRLMEPALETLASEFNVLVWPVSVIGGDASSKAVAPLLCEKDPQKRIAGWQSLYAADAGMQPDATSTPSPDEDCLKAAHAAIDVNNLAFRQFGFAGTPWVISDTGWHLSTGLLASPGTVKLFLNTTDKGTPDDEQTRR